MSFEVTLKVRRYSKEKGSWWREYKLNVDRFTTVVEALRRIKNEQEPIFYYKYFLLDLFMVVNDKTLYAL